MSQKPEKKSHADAQKRYRDRIKEKGLSEVRGIYAPVDKHEKIKAAARKLV